MGWLFNWNRNFGKQDLVEEFKSPSFFNGWKLIDSRVVGNNFWGVIQKDDVRMIWLSLMQSGGKDEGWGYKSMDESCCPSEVNCPVSLIKQCSEPVHEYASEWRKKVEEWHSEQKSSKVAQKSIKQGSRVELFGKAFTLIESAGSRKGWIVKDDSGALFRMNSKQVGSCKLIEKLVSEPNSKKVRTEEQICISF